MKIKKVIFMMISVLSVGSILLSGCSKDVSSTAPSEIKIGVTGPLTGATANSGIALKQGMQLAVDEWNDKGGISIGGKKAKVNMIFEDNQGKPDEGVSATQKLFTQEKVDFLIGDAFSSSVTMAIMDLASQYEKPIMSGEPVSGAISDKVKKDPEKYKYFWKSDYNSSAYGESVYYTVNSAIKSNKFQPKDKTVAFVVENSDYGRSNADAAKALFEKDGWKVVDYETVGVGYTDFYPQFNKLKAASPSVLVSCFTAVSSGVAFTKQFNESGLNAFNMAIYYPVRPEFTQQTKDLANNLMFTPVIFDPTLRANQKDFATNIKSKYNVDATSDHAQGYDEMNLALEAIANAKSLDADKIISQFSTIQKNGLLGKYVFDQSTHTVKDGEDFIPVPGAQIQNGKNQIIWPEKLKTSDYQPQPWIK